jgi:hypothetical protein
VGVVVVGKNIIQIVARSSENIDLQMSQSQQELLLLLLLFIDCEQQKRTKQKIIILGLPKESYYLPSG